MGRMIKRSWHCGTVGAGRQMPRVQSELLLLTTLHGTSLRAVSWHRDTDTANCRLQGRIPTVLVVSTAFQYQGYLGTLENNYQIPP